MENEEVIKKMAEGYFNIISTKAAELAKELEILKKEIEVCRNALQENKIKD